MLVLYSFLLQRRITIEPIADRYFTDPHGRAYCDMEALLALHERAEPMHTELSRDNMRCLPEEFMAWLGEHTLAINSLTISEVRLGIIKSLPRPPYQPGDGTGVSNRLSILMFVSEKEGERLLEGE